MTVAKTVEIISRSLGPGTNELFCDNEIAEWRPH